MNIDIFDVNPGDLVRIGKDTRWSFLEPVLDKDVPVHHLKVNDSFPSVVVTFENGRTREDGKPELVYFPLTADELEYVKHNVTVSDKRWIWIASKEDISDSYYIWYTPIYKNNRYKYMWQRYDENQKYYVCPFCGKKLNPIRKIECSTSRDVDPNYVIKECDCEGWKEREKKYLEMLELRKQAQKLEDEILEGTSLDEFIVPFKGKKS